MYEDEFPKRLAMLRTSRGVSARDMSLSLGQNPGYINAIENGKAFPTMMNFFYICEFLNISPHDFFDMDTQDPEKVTIIYEKLKSLNERQLDLILQIIDEFLNNNA